MNKHHKLFKELKAAHDSGARRGCLSTQVLLASYQGNNNDGWDSCMAAMNSIGGAHAPLPQAYGFLVSCLTKTIEIEPMVNNAFESKLVIPGFGNSFAKGEPDPMLVDLNNIIFRDYPKMNYVINEMTNAVTKHKPVYPNLALYTAAYAHITAFPPQFLKNLFYQLRIDSWMNLIMEYENNKPQ